jgi:hypothetical protein
VGIDTLCGKQYNTDKGSPLLDERLFPYFKLETETTNLQDLAVSVLFTLIFRCCRPLPKGLA